MISTPQTLTNIEIRKMKLTIFTFLLILCLNHLSAQTAILTKHETQFQSAKTYNNPIYDVKDFKIAFT